MVTGSGARKRLRWRSEVGKRVYDERKHSMRIVIKLVGVLAAMLLLTVPVAALSVRGGASVHGSGHDGLVLLPGIAAPAPEELPGSGAGLDGLTGRDRQTILDEIAAGAGYLVGAQAQALPEILPETGMDLSGLTGRDRQTILDQMAAGGGHAWSAQPRALPQAGTGLDGLTGRDRQTILDEMAAGAGVGGTQRQVLPQTSVDLSGLTGRDRQTILDQMAAARY